MAYHEIEISPYLEWIRPYLGKVKSLIPLDTLFAIRAIRPRENQIQHFHAQLTQYKWKEGKKSVCCYSMTIYISYFKLTRLKPFKRIERKFSRIDILEALAHELAHLEHFPHSPQHKKLEKRICHAFMTQLENEGYESEEMELKRKTSRFCLCHDHK